MKIIQSDSIRAGLGTVTASGANDTPAMMVEYEVKTGDTFDATSVIELCELPRNYQVHDLIDCSEDVDGDDAMTSRIGMMYGNPYDTVFANRTSGGVIGDEFLPTGKATTVGNVRRMERASSFAQPANEVKRSIGYQIVAAPTDLTVGKKVRVRVELRPI